MSSIKPGVYAHYKSPSMRYQVLGVAFQTETEELMVIYKPLYDTEYELFARPYDMFVSTVTVNGKTIPRFQKVDDESL